MRILCYILVVLFVTTTAVGQQINPVPDYIFRNSMSVGRNAPTDTSAYFSIGPRFGATRGFMPPMVVDTAAVTGTKRNGLLIYSIQRNSFLYWDSTGSRWSRIAANLDTLQLSTRAWRQKGIDSLASVRIGGSGTTNRVAKFTASGTIGNGSIADSSSSVRMTILSNGRVGINTTTDAGFQFDVNGTARTGTLQVNTDGQFKQISTTTRSGTNGRNLIISGVSANQLTGTTGNESSFLTMIGSDIADSITTGNLITFIGARGLRREKTGTNIIGVGTDVLGQSVGSSNNIAIGNSTMNSLTNGTGNVVIGMASGGMTTTNNSTAVGYLTLTNTAGSDNSAFGAGTLRDVTGAENAAFGMSSMFSLTTGSRNSGLGKEAGRYITAGTANTTSSNSIYVGYDARPSANGNTNEIVIGYQGRGNGSNTVTIGNSSITQNYFTGEMLVGYTSDQGAFSLQANGNALINGNIRTAAPAGGTANDWRLGTVATVSPTSPNRTIEVSIGGTIYYIHAKTTND